MRSMVELVGALVLALGALGGGAKVPVPSPPEHVPGSPPERPEVPGSEEEARDRAGVAFIELATELAGRHRFRVFVLAPAAPTGD